MSVSGGGRGSLQKHLRMRNSCGALTFPPQAICYDNRARYDETKKIDDRLNTVSRRGRKEEMYYADTEEGVSSVRGRLTTKSDRK